MTNKIIKTITCHGVYNHGASLQEMALLKFLNSNDYNAESISYKPSYLASPHEFFSCHNPKWEKNTILKIMYICLKIPSKLCEYKRRSAFNEFSKKYIPSTDIIYKNNDDLIRNPPKASVYICGSDQIWNPLFPNGRDPSFYLDFATKKQTKISYAASFATDELPKEHIAFVKEKVNALNFISVREVSGEKILKGIGLTNVEQVLDPVFLMDITYWNKFKKPEKHKKYIFVYDFDNNIFIKNISEKIKKQLGYQIITVNRNIRYADKNYKSSGPDVFVNLVANSELVLTSSFHALAFSVIFKKKVGVFNRNIDINTRMRDLLMILGMSDKLFYSSNVNLQDCEVNYREVSEKLDFFIENSKRFLINAIRS